VRKPELKKGSGFGIQDCELRVQNYDPEFKGELTMLHFEHVETAEAD
jgi:hypothetical protein